MWTFHLLFLNFCVVYAYCRNSKIKEVLEAENKKRADAERLKQEREKVLASAKAKAQAELRELEGSDEAANAEDNSAAGATAAAS